MSLFERRILKAGVPALFALSLAGGLCGCAPEDVSEIASKAADTVVESAQEVVQEQAPFDFSSTIEPTVLVDNDVLCVTAKSLVFQNDRAVFAIEVQNKTQGSFDLSTSTNGYAANSINEYMIPDGWTSIEVPAGQTVDGEIAFSVEQLMLYGIDEIAEAGFGMRVVNDAYDEIYVGYAAVVTSSSAEHSFDANAYGDALGSMVNQSLYEYSLDMFSSDVFFDQGGISLASRALITNRDGERALNLEFVNATQSEVRLVVSNIVVDGKVVYEGAWDGETIVSGKRGFIDLDFDLLSSVCEESGGLDVGNLSNCEITIAAEDSNGNTLLMPAKVSIPLK